MFKKARYFRQLIHNQSRKYGSIQQQYKRYENLLKEERTLLKQLNVKEVDTYLLQQIYQNSSSNKDQANKEIKDLSLLGIFGCFFMLIITYYFKEYMELKRQDYIQNPQDYEQSREQQTITSIRIVQNEMDKDQEQYSIKKENLPKLSDVIGIDEVLPDFREILSYMKNKQQYLDIGAEIPKGILLFGPPGCGKTFLAQALAGESDWNFIYRSGSSFQSKYVGESSQKIRKLFEKAKQQKPCIIFIDEIDSIAGKRDNKYNYPDDAINQLLTQMDGFDKTSEILIIGATNLQDSLDPAILRAGRFDKKIYIPMPTRQGRQQLFEFYSKKIRAHYDLDYKSLSKKTVGFSPADIKNMVNIAAINAVKRKTFVTAKQDFDYAFDRMTMGITGDNKNKGFDKEDLYKIAVHEIGHTIIAMQNPQICGVSKVTILPVGQSMGHTGLIPHIEDDQQSYQSTLQFIDIALGGRAAEEVFLGKDEITIGCSDDFKKATDLAYEIYQKQAFSKDSNRIINDEKKISQYMKRQYDLKAKELINHRYQYVKEIMNQNRNLILYLCKNLVKHETLDEDSIKFLINNFEKSFQLNLIRIIKIFILLICIDFFVFRKVQKILQNLKLIVYKMLEIIISIL